MCGGGGGGNSNNVEILSEPVISPPGYLNKDGTMIKWREKSLILRGQFYFTHYL